MENVTQVQEKMAGAHPKLTRGRVWCTVCGASRRVDADKALGAGWPRCCGYTMTIDSPAERAAFERETSGGAE